MNWKTVLNGLAERLGEYGPKLLFVVGLGLAGVLLSLLAGRVVRWFVRRIGLEAIAEKAGISPILYVIGVRKGLASLLGTLTFVSGLLLTLAALADAMHLAAVSALTALMVQLLPRLLLAGAVLLGGLSLASVARNVIQRLADQSGNVESPGFVAQLSYWVIVVISMTWSVEQAGLSTDIISSLTKIVLGLSLAALALAFGLGFRNAMSNMVARHYYERMLSPGDRVRIGTHEGLVVRFSPVAVVLETEDGEVIVPCSHLIGDAVHVQPTNVPIGANASESPPDSKQSSEAPASH